MLDYVIEVELDAYVPAIVIVYVVETSPSVNEPLLFVRSLTVTQ